MSENENKLLNIVREDYNPAEAVIITIDAIISFLEQHGSSPKPSPADPQESG